MDKEQLIERVRHYAILSKDFVVRQYHCLADYIGPKYHSFVNYLAEKKKERQNDGCALFFSMRVSKCIFILLNLFYLLVSFFMILMGTSSYVALKSFYDALWLDVQGLCFIWMLSGVLLTCISIYGIIGALKESVAWSNLYAAFLIITFFLQVITSAAAFALVATGSSKSHASDLVDRLMQTYRYNLDSTEKMDYIQTTFQCCGAEYPEDWNNFSFFDGYNEIDYVAYGSTAQPKIQTPLSCCVSESSYVQSTCTQHYSKGCVPYVSEFISEILSIITSVLLAIGVIQIVGMFGALMLAGMFRRTATYRSVRKWRSRYEKMFDTPSHVDYRPLHNSSDTLGDVNQI
ncbi:Tetraspanin-33 [Pseudolycoriella hygida]|uniref:Tetraspanin-33 n=1 Tax=Pseudolycoriella hygida TaxID=35572 RepID=A0A9Q0NAL7_9DIPT|nr:Tetraspanin-33 [Pseudolycoriella hygida]